MSSLALPTAAMVACGFHDAECGGYLADLPLWIALADTFGGPILDLGAGTGRVSLPLAAAGHDVTAVDFDPHLLEELAHRAEAEGVPIRTATADLRTLDTAMPAGQTPAALILIPMQTIQLLGGPDGRQAMFAAAARVAASDAELVISVVLEVEPFDGRHQVPAVLPPDITTIGDFRFESTPRAVLQATPTDQIDMHRRRVVRNASREILGHPEDVVITLDPVTVSGLQAEAATAGWEPGEVIPMPATDEHAGATILAFRRPGRSA